MSSITQWLFSYFSSPISMVFWLSLIDCRVCSTMTHVWEHTYTSIRQKDLEHLLIIPFTMARPSEGTMLDRLPNEILDMIVRQCDGIQTLHSLIKANNRAQALFKQDPKKIFASIIEHSPLYPQFKKMLCTILSIRQCRENIKPEKDHKRFLDRHINTWSTDPILDLDTLPADGAMKLLEDAFDLFDHISQAAQRFVRLRTSKITSTIAGQLSKDRYHRDRHQPSSILEVKPPSETELHRIYRAMWRLYLYYESFYLPAVPPWDGSMSRKCPWDRVGDVQSDELWQMAMKLDRLQRGFFWRMTNWELHEMECVWYHLHQNPSFYWSQRCSKCETDLLPDELFWHYSQGCRTNQALMYNFRETCRSFREGPKLPPYYFLRHLEEGPAVWPDALATDANAGWHFLRDNQRAICPG